MLASNATETFTPDQLLAGEGEVRTTTLTITAGTAIAAIVPMGQITATGVWAIYAPAASDGTQYARALTAEASGTTDAVIPAYVSGVFNTAEVVWPAGITAAQKAVAFTDSMITIKSI